ncbi:MAG: hypothetical protein ACYDCO_23660 [Armatimonadota bacterium]
MINRHAQSGRGVLLLLAIALLIALPSWSGAAKVEINLFEGLTAGTLEDGKHGWTRSEGDDKDGAAPDWWVRFQLPENAPPYLELYQDVWNNGPNLLVTRELRVDEGLKGWQLAGRIKVVNAPENSFFLRVLDDENKAIASLDRFTINHKQGKKGPGDSYFKFNDVPVLPTKATGKAKWSAIMKFTTGDWKPFKITLAAEKPEVLVLEYGDRTVTVPLPPAEVRATAPKTLQLFFGWGLGAQRTGGIYLEELTFSVDKNTEKTARPGD